MAWIEVQLAAAADLVPALEDVLLAVGAQAVTLQDAGDGLPVLEPEPGTHPVWDQVELVALFTEDAPVAALMEDAAAAWQQDHDSPFPTWFERQVQDRDWVDVWRQHWQPMCIGDRLWVLPPETGLPPLPDGSKDTRAALHLEPGLAFGTGTHPTTRLCLEWLAGNVVGGETVIDYGCGSGILGLAALVLGAGQVLATDHDSQALEATTANAATNGVAGRMATFLPDALPEAPQPLVVANILAGPLIELAPRLSALVAPGGRLVLAGLLDDQAERVSAAYPDLVFDDPVSLDGWTRLVAWRPEARG